MDISKEEENYIRISKLIYGEIPKPLRSLFKDKWNAKSPHVWDDKKGSGKQLWTAIPAKKQKKMDKGAKSKIKSGFSDSWDCTALFSVLLFSDLHMITPFESKQIDRLREVRNEHFSHLADSKLSQKDFEDIITEVKDVYDKLGWDSGIVESIKTDSLVTQEVQRLKMQIEKERNAAIKVHQDDFQNVPDTVDNFVGREKEIDDMMECLKNDETKVCYDVVLIHGGPCLGKTAFALSLAHKMLENGFNYVIWIDMRDISNINGPDDVPNMETLAVKILREFKIQWRLVRNFPGGACYDIIKFTFSCHQY